MAITKFVASLHRSKIAYVGRCPPDEAINEFISRGFSVVPLDEVQLATPGFLQQIDSVLFFQVKEKPRKIYSDLKKFASILLSYDCRIYVQHLPHQTAPGGGYHRRYLVNAISELKLPADAYSLNLLEQIEFASDLIDPNLPTFGPYVSVVSDDCTWRRLANTITQNAAGWAPSIDTQINIDDVIDDNAEKIVLLQRAFHDCKQVDLTPLGNGKSGVSTYRAYAELQDSVVPSKWPYLYFVKLGKRAIIAKEHMNYRESAMGHVPFHLGPRLNLERCALGFEYGVLVSDYVSGAESLRDCARNGRATAAIGNLFSSTIAPWRSGATVESIILSDVLADRFPDKIPDHRKSLTIGFGSTLEVSELRNRFLYEKSSPVLMGVGHGDLHATNVLIRGNDAIIIDFEKVTQELPLLFDAASLEAGLFVDGFVGDRRSGHEVLESVEALYTPLALQGDLLTCHPRDGSSWYFDSVHQIRLHTASMEKRAHQYAWTLACVLAKKGCKSEEFVDKDGHKGLSQETVRALAFVLAERIIKAICTQNKE